MKDGWYIPDGDVWNKEHYFKDGVSLCKKFTSKKLDIKVDDYTSCYGTCEMCTKELSKIAQ